MKAIEKMEVIDLCEDESTGKPQIKLPPKSKTDEQRAKQIPRVPPIRVVNLASLQKIKVVNPAQIRSTSRRKSVLQLKPNTDTYVQFIEPVPTKMNAPSTSNVKRVNSFRGTQTTSIPMQTTAKPKVQRPNSELMKRVAFLRVCAEYMLKELGIKNVPINETQSLQTLKAQYFQNKGK